MQLAQKQASGKNRPGGNRYGLCVVCGDRVYSRQEHVTTSDGYCHSVCLTQSI